MLSEQSNHSTAFWATIVTGTLVLGGGATAWVVNARQHAKSAKATEVPHELTVEGITQNVVNGGNGMRSVREAMENDNLTEAQRQQAFRNMREVWRQQMEAHVKEFMNAGTQDEKNAVLDKHLDEMQARMKQWEQDRKDREKEQKADGTSATNGGGGPGGGGRGGFASMSEQERKERSESRNPDERAEHMAYFSAMQSRATERGIPMPGPGGRGGPGGGFGSGRRGP